MSGKLLKGKITIEYCPDGLAISDFAIKSWEQRMIQNYQLGQDALYKVSTILPMYAVRIAVVAGYIKVDDVIFIVDGKSTKINKYGANLDGQIPDPANGYAFEILTLAMKKRKAEREHRNKPMEERK